MPAHACLRHISISLLRSAVSQRKLGRFGIGVVIQSNRSPTRTQVDRSETVIFFAYELISRSFGFPIFLVGALELNSRSFGFAICLHATERRRCVGCDACAVVDSNCLHTKR